MDILFAKKLGKLMNSASARQKAFGSLARPIGRRLDDLAALETLAEAYALPGRFEALGADRAGQFSLRLDANWHLILEPADDPLPRTDDGGVDLTRVRAIRVLEIVDYH